MSNIKILRKVPVAFALFFPVTCALSAPRDTKNNAASSILPSAQPRNFGTSFRQGRLREISLMLHAKRASSPVENIGQHDLAAGQIVPYTSGGKQTAAARLSGVRNVQHG